MKFVKNGERNSEWQGRVILPEISEVKSRKKLAVIKTAKKQQSLGLCWSVLDLPH